jgi:hypothetical protein
MKFQPTSGPDFGRSSDHGRRTSDLGPQVAGVTSLAAYAYFDGAEVCRPSPTPASMHEVLPLQPELQFSSHGRGSIHEADAGVALLVLPRHFSLKLHR